MPPRGSTGPPRDGSMRLCGSATLPSPSPQALGLPAAFGGDRWNWLSTPGLDGTGDRGRERDGLGRMKMGPEAQRRAGR